MRQMAKITCDVNQCGPNSRDFSFPEVFVLTVRVVKRRTYVTVDAV